MISLRTIILFVSITFLFQNSIQAQRTATAVATVVNGFIVAITVTDGGGGYTTAPMITISGGGGNGAKAIAVINDGVVNQIIVQNAGTGYSSTPTVLIPAPQNDSFFIYYETDQHTIAIQSYLGPGGMLSIPDKIEGLPVTSIWDHAFEGHTNLTSVTIPDSVINIEEYVFSGCSSLTSIMVNMLNPKYMSTDGILFNKDQTIIIKYPAAKPSEKYTIPYGITTIEPGAFEACTSLTNIIIPNSITNLGAGGGDGPGAFSYCTHLRSVTIPNSISRIEANAFSGCTDLTDITIPNGVTEIEMGAFGLCTSLTSIDLPDTITTIGWSAFGGCSSLTSIIIPDSVSLIMNGAFSDCSALSNITLGSGISDIMEWTFSGCSNLTNISIPIGITSIWNNAFSYCTSLKEVYFHGNAPNIGTDVFEGSNNATVYYIPGTTGWESTFGGRPTSPWNPFNQNAKLDYILEKEVSGGMIRSIIPSFTNLMLNGKYLLQYSRDFETWVDYGTVFTATNTSMAYSQSWNVKNWDSLFFRLKSVR